MAEPVIVPVQLEVTDVDMSNINFADASKEISKSLSTVKKSIQDAFSGIDTSAINKPIEKSMNAVEKSVQSAEAAYLRYREALINAGKSTEEYKADVAAASMAIKNQEQLVSELSKLGPAATPHLRAAQKELDALIEKRKQINPLNYVDKAESVQLEKVTTALKKVLSAQENVNKQSTAFNKTAKDNRTTDEYQALVKEAESYKKKLEDINEKSKYMAKYGATDNQWEKARNEADWYSAKLDEVVKKLRESVKTGKALRFGNGPKADLSRQINSIAMSGGNQAGAVKSRAMKNESPYTKEYQKAVDELDKLEKKIESIKDKSAKMIELGASKKQFEQLAYDATQLDTKVTEARNNIVDMVNTGSAFKFGNGDADAEISKIAGKADSLKSSLAGVVTGAKKAQGGLVALGATHPKLAAFLTTVLKIGTGLGKVLKVAGKVGSAIVRGFGNAVKVIGKVASSAGHLASSLGRAVSNLISFGKSGSKTSKNLSSRFSKLNKNILMWGFGFRTAYYAIKKLRTIVIDGFKAIGDSFEEVGEPMMRMIESFNRLKGSLATAFQPIVSVVMPILTRLMDYLSGVLEAIGKFNAALTGQGHIYKAVSKDISSVTKSAKEANKQLGSYDKLDVIQKNDTGYDYEKQGLGSAESAASSFAEMVKQAWKNADFTEVGKYVSDQLIRVLGRIEANVVPKVTAFANRLLRSINTFLTGFDANAVGGAVGSIVDAIALGLDWSQVGALFANFNNTIWRFLDGLVNEIDWGTLGQSLATGVTSLFETLDLNTWASMASGLVNGITTALIQFLENMDFAEVATKFGTAVSNMFANMDPEQIGTAINMLFSSAFILVERFFSTDAVGSVATFFTKLIDTINWEGILNKLVSAIQMMLTSAGTALSNSKNPILSAFGKVFLAIDDAITALRPAIDAIVDSIAPITEAVLPIISKLLPPIAKIVSDIVVKLLPPIVKLTQALLPPVIRLVESLLPVLNEVIMMIADDLAMVTDIVTTVVVPVFDALAYIIEFVANMVTIKFKLMRGEFSSVKELFSELLKAWKKPINAILAAVESMVNGVIQGLNAMIRSLNRLSFDIPDWVPKYGGQKFGLNIKELRTISIPRLAQGAVIPPNKEFLAMLGDQKHGTNIEAPLDTIKQALAEVLAELGGVGSKQPIILQVNGRTLAQVVWDEQEKRYKQTGKAMA